MDGALSGLHKAGEKRTGSLERSELFLWMKGRFNSIDSFSFSKFSRCCCAILSSSFYYTPHTHGRIYVHMHTHLLEVRLAGLVLVPFLSRYTPILISMPRHERNVLCLGLEEGGLLSVWWTDTNTREIWTADATLFITKIPTFHANLFIREIRMKNNFLHGFHSLHSFWIE